MREQWLWHSKSVPVWTGLVGSFIARVVPVFKLPENLFEKLRKTDKVNKIQVVKRQLWHRYLRGIKPRGEARWLQPCYTGDQWDPQVFFRWVHNCTTTWCIKAQGALALARSPAECSQHCFRSSICALRRRSTQALLQARPSALTRGCTELRCNPAKGCQPGTSQGPGTSLPVSTTPHGHVFLSHSPHGAGWEAGSSSLQGPCTCSPYIP